MNIRQKNVGTRVERVPTNLEKKSVPLKKEVFHFCEDFHAANLVSSLMLAWRAVSNAVIVTLPFSVRM